jgi:hypothetical protein
MRIREEYPKTSNRKWWCAGAMANRKGRLARIARMRNESPSGTNKWFWQSLPRTHMCESRVKKGSATKAERP